MKKILLLLMALLSVFFITWGVKAKTPINRPSDLEEEQETPWYENKYTAPQAGDEWYLDPEIPLNYIPVPGEDELYMVVDDSGNITGYRHRTQQADGSWVWEDVNPDIPDNYEKVDGLDNVYKVTDQDGNTSYYKYVRNDDDTYCFVPVNENGTPLDDGTSAETIGDNYVHVSDNIYAVYNDDNVKMGYRERVKDDSGNYVWKVCDAPAVSTSVGNGLGSIAKNSGSSSSSAGSGTSGNSSGNAVTANNNVLIGNSGNNSKTDNGDGTYTVTDKTTSTETKDGYLYTYETTVYSTYDSSGNLLSTRKDGPYEVSKVAAGNTSTEADQSQIASTLDGELSRVSASVSFDTDKATEVLSKLNAERKSQGLSALSMSTSSEAYKLACIRAADMAIYDHSSSSSPMYGTLDNMVSMFGCSSSHPSENIWKASSKSAAEIHTRFQANESSRSVRMSSGYSEVGIAIVEQNGQSYIAEIYLQ